MVRQMNKTIVLVEDDTASALLTRRYLQRAGISNEIIEFSHGREFLHFICDNLTCGQSALDYVFVLDLQLPDISGFELLGIIRSAKIRALKLMPIIIHTSSDQTEDRKLCEELGADAYCVKDFTSGFRLSDVLQEYLETHVMAS